MKFLVTEECGKLARWLRLMGYDAAWMPGRSVRELYRLAYNERRVLVTRNKRLRASSLFPVVHLTSPNLEEQLRQLIHERSLAVDDEQLFTRCNLCNVPVEPIEKSRVKDRVPPHVYHTQETFRACPSCKRIYWAATHWQRAKQLMATVKASG